MLKLFHSLDLKLKSCLIALFGSAFLAFGLLPCPFLFRCHRGRCLRNDASARSLVPYLPIRVRLHHEPRLLRDGMEAFWGGSSSPTPFFPAPASPCLTGSVSSFRPCGLACRYAACRIPARRGLRRHRCRALRADRRCPGGDDALAMSLST